METLAPVLEGLGYASAVFSSLPAAVEGIAEARERGQAFVLAVVELISGDGTSGLTHRAALQAAGLDAPVIVSSDAEVRGYGEHGFAGAIRRPFVAEEVRRVVEEALAT